MLSSQNSFVFTKLYFSVFYHSWTHSLSSFFIQQSFNPILSALEEVSSGIGKEQDDVGPEQTFCGQPGLFQ